MMEKGIFNARKINTFGSNQTVMATHLEKFNELVIEIEKQKKKAIEEIIALIEPFCEDRPKAEGVEKFSFIKVARSANFSRWDLPFFTTEFEDAHKMNLRAVLQRSRNLTLTLSRIVQYGNMPKLKLRGLPMFYVKVKPEWIEVIKTYLGDALILQTGDQTDQ